jgi:hypothetical protein
VPVGQSVFASGNRSTVESVGLMPLAPGAQPGPYEILAAIGEGGMGGFGRPGGLEGSGTPIPPGDGFGARPLGRPRLVFNLALGSARTHRQDSYPVRAMMIRQAHVRQRIFRIELDGLPAKRSCIRRS